MNMKKPAASLLPLLHKNKIKNAVTGTTAEDVADLVEYAINEAEPKIKTKRGIGSTIRIKIGGRKFFVKVIKPFRRRTKSRGNGF